MISSLAKVMGLQNRPSKTHFFNRHQECSYGQRKDVHYDRSDNNSHFTYYFQF